MLFGVAMLAIIFWWMASQGEEIAQAWLDMIRYERD
jgi:hypothetical protein